MPDMSAPGTDDTYLNNPASAVEDQERLRAQQEAQRRYEEELARQQELAMPAPSKPTRSKPLRPWTETSGHSPTATAADRSARRAGRRRDGPSPDARCAGSGRHGPGIHGLGCLTEEQITPDVAVRAGRNRR